MTYVHIAGIWVIAIGVILIAFHYTVKHYKAKANTDDART